MEDGTDVLHPPTDTIEEIFISPRVVDRQAFEEYSTTLRKLVERSNGLGTSLEASATKAERTLTDISAAGAEIRAKADAVAHLLATLDARVRQVDEQFKTTDERAQYTQRFEQRIDDYIEEATKRAMHKVDEALERAVTRVRLSESGLLRRVEEMEKQIADSLGRRTSQLEKLVSGIDERLAPIHERIERAITRVDHLADGLEEKIAQRSEPARERMEQIAAECCQQAEQACVEIQRRVDSARTQVRDAGEQAQSELSSVRDGLREQIDEARAGGIQAASEARAAAELVSQEIQAAAQQARKDASAGLDDFCSQAEKLSEQIERRTAPARQLVERAINDLETRARAVEQSILARTQEPREILEKALGDLEARAARLQTKIEAITGPDLHALASLFNRAKELLGREAGQDSATPAVTNSLEDLVERGERAREDAAFVTTQFDSMREQTDDLRTVLGRSLLEASDVIDRMTEREESLRALVNEPLGIARETEDGIPGAESTEHLEGHARMSTHSLWTATESASGHLTDLLEQAAATKNALEVVVREHHTEVERVEAMLPELRSWRAMMLDSHSMEELPMVIQRILNEVRGHLIGAAAEPESEQPWNIDDQDRSGAGAD